MRNLSFDIQAERYRQRAAQWGDQSEAGFLLQIACCFEELATRRSSNHGPRSPNLGVSSPFSSIELKAPQ
jgi:hypothetical protein